MAAARKKAGNKEKTGDEASDLRFEDHLERIEHEVERLEEGNLSLEDSLKTYEVALASLKACHALLESAEGRIRILTNADEANPKAATYDADSGHALDDESDLEDDEPTMFG